METTLFLRDRIFSSAIPAALHLAVGTPTQAKRGSLLKRIHDGGELDDAQIAPHGLVKTSSVLFNPAKLLISLGQSWVVQLLPVPKEWGIGMKWLRILGLLLTLAVCQGVQAQTATVSWATTSQTMDGFGASTGFNEGNPNLTSAQADCFFSLTNGSCATGNSIGLSWIKAQDNRTVNSTPSAPTVKLAHARGAKFHLGFNGPLLSGGDYASQATYMVGKIQYWQNTNGVPVSAIGVLNEPENSGTTAAELDTFISTFLVPALATAGFSSIPIVLGEASTWFTADYVTTCMNDAACGPNVSIVAGHGYGGETGDGFNPRGFSCCTTYALHPVPRAAAGKKVWQSEVNGGATGPCAGFTLPNYNATISDALVWAHNIHDFLTVANGSNWMYWNLNSGYAACNDGLTDTALNPAKRFYAIGNWSKYVRSGWLRIDATPNPASGVYVTAFKDPSLGNFAIVAINQNSFPVTVNFSLSGFPSVASVTPTVTSASVNLVDQTDVTVTGAAFSDSLPATSIVTFHATSSPSISKIPAPPTNLALTIN